MRHFFILGSNPVLSAAEIIALLPGHDFTITELYKHALIVQAAPGATLDAAGLMARLGGTIKIGTLLDGEYPVDPSSMEKLMLDGMRERIMNVGNVTYGLSVYSLSPTKAETHAATVNGSFRNVGMSVKKKLREVGCAARWVKAQTGTALTSVAVAKNKMLVDGAEFVALAKEGAMYVGTTTVVQPFEDFSKADYGRPERDPVQGMLPPKLARMMINLIHVSKEVKDIALYDPFCGSGTVLTEGMRIGFRHVVGSDLNPEAIASTLANIDWTREQGMVHAEHVESKVFPSDARLVGAHLQPGSIDAIVTEPYLGPPMKGNESRSEMQKRLDELTKLYAAALRAWKPLLAPDAPVVMAMPVYIHGLEKHGIDTKAFEVEGFRTESLLPSMMIARMGTKETRNKGLLYGRNDQRVWREIVRLRAVS
jgi:tRNA G10  N-methylase Trm11